MAIIPDYIMNVYKNVREFKARATITILEETKVYDDETIIKMNILNEISTLNEFISSNELVLTMDNTSGDFSFLNNENKFDIIASLPKIYVELGLVYNPLTDPESEQIEWLPGGLYYLTEWKNDNTSQVVTLTGNDVFDMFGDQNFIPTGETDLQLLARDVIQNHAIAGTNYFIDNALSGIIVNEITEPMNIRELLQMIVTIGKAVIYQSRDGTIMIFALETVDTVSEYSNYTTSQLSLTGYSGSNVYPLINTENGMNFLSFEQMYKPPEISINKTIYQLIINIYESGISAGPTLVKTYTFFNANENNGYTYTMDIPILKDPLSTDDIALWYYEQSNLNALNYVVSWRQNPILDCTNLIYIQDSFGNAKKSRITKQEFVYEGYLEGITESRGGI